MCSVNRWRGVTFDRSKSCDLDCNCMENRVHVKLVGTRDRALGRSSLILHATVLYEELVRRCLASVLRFDENPFVPSMDVGRGSESFGKAGAGIQRWLGGVLTGAGSGWGRVSGVGDVIYSLVGVRFGGRFSSPAIQF